MGARAYRPSERSQGGNSVSISGGQEDQRKTGYSSLVIKEFIKGNLHTRCVLQLQDEMDTCATCQVPENLIEQGGIVTCIGM